MVDTFIQRIKEVNPIINAMVDARWKEETTNLTVVTRFAEALEEAARVDRELAGLGGEERRERCGWLHSPLRIPLQEPAVPRGPLHYQGIQHLSRASVQLPRW